MRVPRVSACRRAFVARIACTLTILLSLATVSTRAFATDQHAVDEPTNLCQLTTEDATWLQRAAEAWTLTRSSRLLIDEALDAPLLVFFDAHCTYQGVAVSALDGKAHHGELQLPDGKRMPPELSAFAAPLANDAHAFFVMALPQVWRDANVRSELGLATLITAVLIHELTHTRQFYAFGPRIHELSVRWQLGDDLTDDAVQDRFGNDAAYTAAYERERDLLFAAAASADLASARATARTALQHMQARGAKYFVGPDAKYKDLDEVFLTLEGLAQWAGYAWLIHPRGGAVSPAAALRGLRRDGGQWSQDEGLAIFLVLDRLLPNWQQRAFAAQPATALEMLRVATESPPAVVY